MRPILWACLISAGMSCARTTRAPSGSFAVASAPDAWRSCSVARTIARQFVRGLSLLGEVKPYLVDDAISFRVCDRENLNCNLQTQPFADCKDRFFSQSLSKSIETSWSTVARPLERRASYAVVFLDQRADEIVAELSLRYQFAGNPDANTAGPQVWAGMSETSDDVPEIRIVIPKNHPTTTRESVILLGEREIGP